MVVTQILRKVVRACSIFNPHEGYRSVTPLDAASCILDICIEKENWQMRFCAGQMSRAIYQSNASSLLLASHELSIFSRATRNEAAFQDAHSCTHDPALQPHRPHRDRCLRQLRGLLRHQLAPMGGYEMRQRLLSLLGAHV